jgi:hypothetical protein
MTGVNVEKIELTCHIVRTHNRIELPKFILAHPLALGFLGVGVGFAAIKQARTLDLAQDISAGKSI